MKALLLILVVLCGAIGTVVAQKKSTLIGDIVIGKIAGKDEATREITIEYRGKEGIEIFSGILVDGYKLRIEGSRQELQLSEIVPGMYIRLYYKTGREKVSGQEKKINKITKVDVLGNDEYFRIRDQVKLDQSTTIEHAEEDDIPASSPLKVCLSIAFDHVHQDLVTWIDKWNRKNGDSYGKLELVSDMGQADVLIVVARGADTMVAALPMLSPDGREVAGVWAQGTTYLVVKDAGRMKVIWTRVAGVFSGRHADVSRKTTESVIDEMEKRMKARAPKSKK